MLSDALHRLFMNKIKLHFQNKTFKYTKVRLKQQFNGVFSQKDKFTSFLSEVQELQTILSSVQRVIFDLFELKFLIRFLI